MSLSLQAMQTMYDHHSEMLPAVTPPIAQIFSQFSNGVLQDKPCYIRSKIINLKATQKDLNDAAKTILKEKKHARFHKIASLILLAVSVAIVATAVLLAVFVAPILAVTAVATLVPAFTATVLGKEFPITPVPIPFIYEILYIYRSFFKNPVHKIEYFQNLHNESIEKLQKDKNHLQSILEHKDEIQTAINNELESLDLKAPFLNLNRIQDLNKAYNCLNNIDDFLNQRETAESKEASESAESSQEALSDAAAVAQ